MKRDMMRRECLKRGGNMLHYTEAGLSHNEVPDETSLCIYISGCVNRCKECHYPELQDSDYGDLLYKYIKSLIQLYLNQVHKMFYSSQSSINILFLTI